MGTRLNQLRAGEALDSFFLVASSREGTTRHGSTYLTIELRDATGSRTAKVWRPDEALPTGFDVPGVYRVVGRTDTYRDELQIAVDRITAFRPSDDEMSEITSASRWSPDTLVGELRAHIEARVRSPQVLRLLLYILDHPDVRPRLGTAPAATNNHHAFRSGLAEHSLSMMRLASLIAHHYDAYYPGLVNGDLLVAGCLLHDLGKVWELGGELTAEYTDAGRLVGHIPMGVIFLDRVARELGDVPESLLIELQHLVLSHHGQLDFGSPKRPKTVEAQILHQVDMLDSRVNAFAQIEVDGWTPYHRMFGHAVLTGPSFRASWAPEPDGAIHDRGPGHPTGAGAARASVREPSPAAGDGASPREAVPTQAADAAGTVDAPTDEAARADAAPARKVRRARSAKPAAAPAPEVAEATETPETESPGATKEEAGPDRTQPSLFDGLD